jgi:hypothetical protein
MSVLLGLGGMLPRPRSLLLYLEHDEGRRFAAEEERLRLESTAATTIMDKVMPDNSQGAVLASKIARLFVRLFSLAFFLVGSPWISAADSIPFLELTYRAADGCRPPAPIDAWWTESCQEAIDWWNATTGSTVDCGQALTSLDSLHLVAGGVPAADGFLTPTFAGWIRETSPFLSPGLIASLARWDGWMTEAIPGGCRIRSAQVRPPEDAVPPLGLRIVLHGSGLGEEMKTRPLPIGYDFMGLPRRSRPPPDAKGNPQSDDLELFLAGIVSGWHASAGIEPHPGGATGWLAMGFPSRWFKPVDGAALARLPADAQAWLAVGIDGHACGVDLQAALAAQGRTSVWPIAWFPHLDPALLGLMLDGTWIVVKTPTGIAVRVPRSTALDAWIAGLGVSLHQTYPVDEHPVALVEGLLWARSSADWIIGTSPGVIAGCFTTGAGQPPRLTATALVAGYGGSEVTSSFISPALRRQEPGPNQAWPQLFDKGGNPVAATTWTAMAAALERAGDHHLLGTDNGGTLRIELDGPVLPWLLPGLAIRWFADIAQDEEGKRALLSGMKRLRTAGRPATLAEYRKAVPPSDPLRLAALEGEIDVLLSLPYHPEMVDRARQRLSDEPLPWQSAGADRAAVDKAHGYIASTAFLDDPALQNGRIMAMGSSEGGFAEALEKWQRKQEAARQLAGISLFLACHGDSEWTILSQRAIGLVSPPENWVDADSLRGLIADRDMARLATIVARRADRAEIDHWLAEGVPALFCASAWRNTSISTSWVSIEPWLAQGADYPGRFTLPDGPTPRMGLLLDQATRANTASEFAFLLDCYERMARQELPLIAPLNASRSPWIRMFQPESNIERAIDHGYIDQAKHVMVRTAARLVLLDQAGHLPESQAMAVAALSPFVCPIGATHVPLTYQHLGEHAFRLIVSDQVPPPPGIDPGKWQDMVVKTDVPGGRHLVVGKEYLEVVIDSRRPTPAKVGSNDF